jgi:drug/metabolite transporter (DMT)-like permease
VQRTTHAFLAVLTGSALWGLSGTAAQALFEHDGFPPLGLGTIRLLAAGSLLWLLARPSLPTRWTWRLVAFGILGLAVSQLGYLEAISYSNAVTATLLQFLFLPMVAGYEVASGVLRWDRRWALTFVLAVVGTFLLVGVGPKGQLEMAITALGVVFGVLSAVGGAYYSIAGRELMAGGTASGIMTWGFLVGGLASLPFGVPSLTRYPWAGGWSGGETVLLIGFVVVFGTLIPFTLYVSALRHLSATQAGVGASMEPIMSAVATFLFLGVRLSDLEYLGGGLLLLAVLVAGRERAGLPRTRGGGKEGGSAPGPRGKGRAGLLRPRPEQGAGRPIPPGNGKGETHRPPER